jgi:hypothetical protein
MKALTNYNGKIFSFVNCNWLESLIHRAASGTCFALLSAFYLIFLFEQYRINFSKIPKAKSMRVLKRLFM